MTLPKPGPTTVPLTEPFWDAAREGRLLLQRCRRCGRHQHYPRILCRQCWHTELDWIPSSGRGRVWTFTVVHRPGHAAWDSDVPYTLAIVELDEGPRLLTNVVGIEPGEVTVDLRVRARFTRQGEATLVHFEPAE